MAASMPDWKAAGSPAQGPAMPVGYPPSIEMLRAQSRQLPFSTRKKRP
jgi:hypothetical protein